MKEPLITFYEDSHLYFHKKRILKSVSGWIKDYSHGFNSNYWLSYKVLQHNFSDLFEKFKKGGYKHGELLRKVKGSLNKNQIFIYNTQIKILSDSWKWEGADGGSKGTQFHWIEEHKAFQDGVVENPFTNKKFKVIDIRRKNVPYQNHSLGFNLLEELEDGYYPEFLAWYLPIETAGQIDRLWIETIKGVRYVFLDDFKTNKAKNMKGGGMNKLKGVLNHIDENPIEKYSIQINFYAWMLWMHGFEPRNLSFTHYTNYNINKSKKFTVKFNPNLIESMIVNHQNLKEI